MLRLWDFPHSSGIIKRNYCWNLKRNNCLALPPCVILPWVPLCIQVKAHCQGQTAEGHREGGLTLFLHGAKHSAGATLGCFPVLRDTINEAKMWLPSNSVSLRAEPLLQQKPSQGAVISYRQQPCLQHLKPWGAERCDNILQYTSLSSSPASSRIPDASLGKHPQH